MRIGIDARMFGARNAGIGRYIEQLVTYLQKIDTRNHYILFLKKENFDTVYISNNNFSKVLADIHWYGWEEQITFSSIIEKASIDVMHFPHWNIPLSYTAPYVLTLHDLIMYHYPRKEASTLGPLAYWVKDKVMRRVVAHAVKHAAHIFVTSEFTKYDAHNTLKVPLENMNVIYQAPLILPSLSEEKKYEVFQKFSIVKPYVLYVGSAYPHKNVEGLLKAWELFNRTHTKDHQLVLAGKENYFYKRIKDTMPLVIKDSVVFTNFVDDHELSVLYKNAELFVFPSFYEGFGLPPLEAMNAGVPVLSSNRACMPEVLGQGALYFDPEDYDACANAMHNVLTDHDLRAEILENARVELKRYSWENLANQTLSIYDRFFK